MKILFIHGLESGPGGHKHTYLKQNHTVLCPDMSNYSIFTRSFYRIPYFIAGFFSLPLIFYVAYLTSFWILLLLPLYFLLIWRMGCDYVVKKCFSIQVESIKTWEPELLVASSFGGAILLLLIKEKIWQGPSLLLAPAQGAISRKCFLKGVFKFERGFGLMKGKLLLVHGSKDEICPLQDSLDLVKSVGDDKIELKIVEDTHSLRKEFDQNGESLVKKAIDLYNNAREDN
jgi:hypothetical protein